MKTSTSSIVLVLIASIFSAIGQILFKYTSENVTTIFSLFFNEYFYFAGVCYVIGFILLMFSLKNGEATVIYPLLASAYVWVCLISPMLFNTDFMNIKKWIGIIIIIIGIYFIIRGSNHV
jgi:drug/metabolite transporter (DMT)-like permease